jgi:hypothetical protein
VEDRHVAPGVWWFATTGRHVGHDWWLERDQLIALDAGPNVIGVVAQPFWFHAPALEQRRKHPQLEPDDDLPLGMTLLQVCKRIWDLLEREHPIGHRFQLTAIDQSRQHIKVVSAGMHE